KAGWRVAPHERRHRSIASLGQRWQELAPRVCGVREPVEAQRERTMIASAKHTEFDAVRGDVTSLQPSQVANQASLRSGRRIIARKGGGRHADLAAPPPPRRSRGHSRGRADLEERT